MKKSSASRPFKISLTGLDKSHRNYSDPAGPRYADYNLAPARPLSGGRFTVVTYNIRYGLRIKEVLKLLKEHERFHEIDAFCLQEMDLNGVQTIAGALRYNYIYYPAVVHPKHNRDFGNAILTRWPIISDQKIILPYLDEKRLQRIAVGAIIAVGEAHVMLFSIHMRVFLQTRYRISQLKTLLDEIPDNIRQAIIAGDFNTFTKKAYKSIADYMETIGFRTATENADWTYSHWYLLNKKSKLDHVFVRGLSVVNSEKIHFTKASDHYPVWTELSLSC